MIALVFTVSAVGAAPVQPAPNLLPTAIVRPLLEHDPRVAGARAGLEVARQEAGILDSSPYEWTTKLSGQRRTLQGGPRYQEWNAGVERTLRLPRKAAADRTIGKASIEEAEARYSQARQEAARELLTLWLDWLAAEGGYELATANRQSSQENLTVVEKRLRAGDAAKLDVSLAQAELAEQKRVDNDAKTQASVAWARLHARFPDLDRQFARLPTPAPLTEAAAVWRDRILAKSAELKIGQAQMKKTQAQGERMRAERTPDPTLGLYTASESGGQERITGISISIPIPGDQRSQRATKAVHEAEVNRQEVELRKRQLEAEIASALENVGGTYESMQIAESGAAAMQNNAKLMQRAYSLGEGDLQALLSARRQATAASQNALAAKVAAIRSYYFLLIDAQLIWDLDHKNV